MNTKELESLSEEVLKKIPNQGPPVFSYSKALAFGKEMYQAGADKQQEAVGFAEWKERNGWWADEYNERSEKFDTMRWSNNSVNPQFLTTTELYLIFKNKC